MRCESGDRGGGQNSDCSDDRLLERDDDEVSCVDNFYNLTQHACAVLAARASTPIGQGRNICAIDATTVAANDAFLLAVSKIGRSLEAIPITQGWVQSNPRVRALRRQQVPVRDSTLRHAPALPCIRPTV